MSGPADVLLFQQLVNQANQLFLSNADSVVINGVSVPTLAKIYSDFLTNGSDQFAQLRAGIDSITADPLNAVTSWAIPAKGFDLVQGSPAFSAVSGRLAAWQFAQSVAAYVATPLTLPSHWQTMDVYVLWVNTVANNGNVVLGGEIHQWGVGDNVNVTPVGGSGIFAASATPWLVTESKVASNLGAPLNSGKNTTLRVARQGASGNDTLLNSIAILAVRLVKKS